MATTVKSGGDWSVDVGDQLSQAFTLTEDGSAVDNWDDVVVQVDIFSSTYGTLTLRSDDADPQVVKSAGPTPTTATVTLTESDTSANFTGRYRIVVIDPTEDERTTHVAAPFRVVGNYAGVAPGTFSAVDLTSHLTSSSAHTAANIPIVDSGGFITATDVEGALQELGSVGGVYQVSKSGSDLGILKTTSWADADTGGSAAARPLDLIVPNVSAGQWVTLSANGYSAAVASGGQVDLVTVVSGAKVNHVGDTTAGVTAWVIDNNGIKHLAGSIDYQVQADDIESDAVRFRLQTKRTLGAATTRTFLATGGFALRMAARGPFD